MLWAVPAGATRRGEDWIDSIEIVAAAVDRRTAVKQLFAFPDLDDASSDSPETFNARLEGVRLTVRFPEVDRAGSALVEATGSDAHVAALRALGEWPARERSEDGVYAALGLPWIPPEIRVGNDEITAARTGTLPTLVSRPDIRGDLHMHTQWSDGRESVEAMAAACSALGYEYIAITDHSVNAAASRTLAREDVPRQADEIAAVRERFPSLAILHGVEVDILPDGRLDFEDDLLERFDLVLASLHVRANQGPEQLLDRYLGAIRHPLVNIITHPANRLLSARLAYELDWPRLFAEAAETGTALEIDGSPSHLDLDGPMARQAISQGAMVSIDSDCHMSDRLARQMHLGLGLARRGWVEPRHVLNAKPLAEVRRVVEEKRRR
jgi:DNA polymerase (family 10)